MTMLLYALFQSLASWRQRAAAVHDGTCDLHASESDLAAAQRTASPGDWWLDLEHGRMHWSHGALRLLGRSRADAPADFDAMLACIHENDRTDPEVALPRHVAKHDPLTGLPNRRHLHQALTAGIARAERCGQGLGVLFLDLDRFKNINDALGHSSGDAVLKMCGQRFAEALRESDLVAHISGDEFVVLLEPCSEANAASAVARKLLDAAGKPVLLNGQEIALTASIGIALYPSDGADGETLLKHADIAHFRAKEQGRNNCQFYSAQMSTRTAERLAA